MKYKWCIRIVNNTLIMKKWSSMVGRMELSIEDKEEMMRKLKTRWRAFQGLLVGAHQLEPVLKPILDNRPLQILSSLLLTALLDPASQTMSPGIGLSVLALPTSLDVRWTLFSVTSSCLGSWGSRLATQQKESSFPVASAVIFLWISFLSVAHFFVLCPLLNQPCDRSPRMPASFFCPWRVRQWE